MSDKTHGLESVGDSAKVEEPRRSFEYACKYSGFPLWSEEDKSRSRSLRIAVFTPHPDSLEIGRTTWCKHWWSAMANARHIVHRHLSELAVKAMEQAGSSTSAQDQSLNVPQVEGSTKKPSSTPEGGSQ